MGGGRKKVFFSEEKNQKTFMSLVRAVRKHGSKDVKVFCVAQGGRRLFSKK